MSSLNQDALSTASDMIDALSEAEADLQSLSEELTATELARYEGALLNSEKYFQLKKALAKKYNLEELEEELEILRKSGTASAAEILAKEKEVADTKKKIKIQSLNGTVAYEKYTYERASVAEKAQIQKSNQEKIQKRKAALEEQREMEISAALAMGEDTAKIEAEYAKKISDLDQQQSDARIKQLALEEKNVTARNSRLSAALDNLKDHPSMKSAGEAFVQLHLAGGEALQEMLQEQKRIAKEASDEARKRREDYQKVMDDPNSTEDDKKKAEKAYKDAVKVANEANKNALKGELADQVAKAFKAQFQQVEGMMQSYQSHIEARLQGSGKSYGGLLGIAGIQDTITSVLSINPFVKSKEVLDAVKKASDQGIAYNIEQRAFLATISDKIANTFDAFDSNLTRLIRLQQADTTAARLGMEASLTKFLNQRFEDTSYLSDVADSVSQAIIDANASMSRDMSAEFEYTLHKWLGSLSSLGMSNEAITEIAKGINYLATGDVTSLSSSTELQTLIAMSASEAGLEYSELLLNGLNAKSTNKLMASMVAYLKRIAETSENQVVRSAYGDIYNLSMSDMRAISNLRTDEIESIASTMMTYSDMQSELNTQFEQIALRTHVSEMLGNLFDNAVFGVAADIVGNPATYGMYKMLEFMSDQKLDMEIPFVNAAGFGLGVGNSVQDLLRLGLGMAQATSLLTNMLAGLHTGGGMKLDKWRGAEYTKRGTSEAFSTGAVSEGLSSSIYVETNELTKLLAGDSSDSGSGGASGGSGSGGSSDSNANYVASGNFDDMKNSTLNSATDDSEETSEITNKNLDAGFTIDDFYKVTVEGEEGSGKQRTTDTRIKEVFNDKSSNFLSTQDYRMVYTGGSLDSGLRVHDNYLQEIFSDNSILTSGHTAVKVVLDGLNSLEGMLLVDEKHLTNAYESTEHYIAVKDIDMRYEGESLKVYDTNADVYNGLLPFLSGESSFSVKLDINNEDTALPVSNTVLTSAGADGYIKVQDTKAAYQDDAMKVYNTNTSLEVALTPFLTKSDSFLVKLSVTSTDSALPVSNSVLTAVGTSTHLKVQDSRMSFVENVLAVHDSKLDSVFSTTGILTGSAVKVKIQEDPAAPIVVKINNISDVVKALSAETFKVALNDDSIKKLGAAITGEDTKTTKKEAKTIADLYALFSDTTGKERAHVRIQNEDGKRLQVDTEVIGTSTSYDTNWDLSKNIKW